MISRRRLVTQPEKVCHHVDGDADRDGAEVDVVARGLDAEKLRNYCSTVSACLQSRRAGKGNLTVS